MKSRKTKKNLFYKIISILLVISSACFLGYMFYIDLLPVKYSTILIFIILLFNIFSLSLINIKKVKK